MEELLGNIQAMGLTQYEAKVYLSLVPLGLSNAYQISKISGVPRARVYDVLDGLVQHGLVMKQESEGGAHYSSLPVDVFLESMKSKWEETYSSLEKELKALEKQEREPEIYVSTVKGEDNILSFCRVLIRRARKRIVLSMWEPMYCNLMEDLKKRQEGCLLRGILFQVNDPLPGLELHRKTHYVEHVDHPWFIVSVDGQELFYGNSIEQGGNAFYTDDPAHIYLLEDYIWHDVLVNRLVGEEKREEMDQWIAPARKSFFGEIREL
jgi:sugar-specific transcriptional regulator TrmB